MIKVFKRWSFYNHMKGCQEWYNSYLLGEYDTESDARNAVYSDMQPKDSDVIFDDEYGIVFVRPDGLYRPQIRYTFA